MPYVSDRQRRWAHSPAGMKALGASKVKEFDSASKGLKLPETSGEEPPKKKKKTLKDWLDGY